MATGACGRDTADREALGLTGGDGGYDTVSTFFSEILGLTLKVFGDLSGHSELVVRGSLSDRNLLGF